MPRNSIFDQGKSSSLGNMLRRGFALKCLAICLALSAAGAWGWQDAEKSSEANPLGSSGKIIAGGHGLYDRSCTGCHGVNGAAGERGPALAGQRDYVRDTDRAIFEAVKNGIAGTGMPPSGLAPNDIWKIVAYIRSLRASASDAYVPGDVAQGERIFRNRCAECHMIAGRGGIRGPDLSNIGGARTLQQIRTALTQSPKQIPSGYLPAEVTTKSGQQFSGIIKNQDNFSLELLDDHNQLRLLTCDELRDIRYRSASLMPADYDRTLSPAEFQDLLAFLSRQTLERSKERDENK